MLDAALHFVVFDWSRWESTLRRGIPTIGRCAADVITNEDVWVVQTWLQLIARGLRATIGPEPRRNAINIVDGINLGAEGFDPESFYVGCRGDGHYPAICQVVLHQNTLAPADQPGSYLPQWPQPGLIPRDDSRRGISRLGFFGHASINLAAEFRDPDFGRELRRRDCHLEIRGRTAGRVSWNDYSEIDLVLSARSIPWAHRLLKPVNKLTNAWLARVPALIGLEPAVEAIRESTLDYVAIANATDALEALDRLRADPALYRRMIEHGSRRADAFSEEAVAASWFGLLENLQVSYDAWSRLDRGKRAANFARRAAAHREHFARHAQTIHHGYSSLGFGQKWWETPDTAAAVAHG